MLTAGSSGRSEQPQAWSRCGAWSRRRSWSRSRPTPLWIGISGSDPYSADLRGAAGGLLQCLQGGGLIHAGAPQQVNCSRADLTDEHADGEVVPLFEYLGGLARGIEGESARLFRTSGFLEVSSQSLHRPGEVQHRLWQLRRDSVPAIRRVGRAARQHPRVDDCQVYPGASVGVELEVPEGPATGRGEPGCLVAGGEGLVEALHSIVVDSARAHERAFGPLAVTVLERCGDIFEHHRQLVEDRARGPLHEALGVYREEVVDGKGDTPAHERIEETGWIEGVVRGLEHDDEERRDCRLVYQERPTPEEHRRRHRQKNHDPDLRNPSADEEHQKICDHEPDGDAERDLDGAPHALAERNPQGDNRRYGGEERPLVPEHKQRQRVRDTSSHRALDHRPALCSEPVCASQETAPKPTKDKRPSPTEPTSVSSDELYTFVLWR